MKRSLLIVTVIFFGLCKGVNGQNTKRALNLLEKKDFLKVEQTFTKSIEKDSINPGAYYVYSLLYLTDSFPRYSLDSSYLLILQAIDQYGIIDQKEIERLDKIDISDSTLWFQKNRIDSLAYEQVLIAHEESNYNLFLAKHPSALQLSRVKTLRNGVAYKKAVKIHTYQSYKKFMDKYPDASEFGEAEDNYNQLLFGEKTGDGSLKSYQHFLSEYPHTPYRKTIEKHIFEISTAGNNRVSYEKFIDKYPKSKLAKKALDYLYYHHLEGGGAHKDFLTKYASIPQIDSIKKATVDRETILFPIFENQQYKFIDQTGKLLNGLVLNDDIEEAYYCKGVQEDYIIVQNETGKSIITKSGTEIYKGPMEAVKPLGFGLLKISNHHKHGIIHCSGWEVFPSEWDNISLISDQFLVVQKNELLGLATLSGRIIFTPQFQDIQADGEYYMFTKADKIAIINKSRLTELFEANNPFLDHIYDDYQIIDQHYVIGIRGPEECLINDNLEMVISLAPQKIYDQPTGWYVIKSDTFFNYNHQLKPILTARFDKYQFNEGWVALKKGDKWALFNSARELETDYEFDSLQFLSKNIIFLVRDGDRSILLANGDELQVNENQNFQLLQSNFERNNNDEHILVFDSKKRTTTIHNANGEKIKSLINTQFNSLHGKHFIIEKNSKKGIMDRDGKVILPTYYDAIGKPKDGAYSLLRSNKFGLYNPSEEFTIKAEYQSPLATYNKNLLVANKSDKKGLIDHKNKPQTPFIFEKIDFWSDSLALVYGDGYWGVYDIYKNEYVIDNITNLQITSNVPEKKAIILGENGYGVLSNKSGMIIPPTFDDLRVIGQENTYLYFCEKHVKEAELYVVVYYDKTGKRVRRQVYDDEVYDKIYCEN